MGARIERRKADFLTSQMDKSKQGSTGWFKKILITTKLKQEVIILLAVAAAGVSYNPMCYNQRPYEEELGVQSPYCTSKHQDVHAWFTNKGLHLTKRMQLSKQQHSSLHLIFRQGCIKSQQNNPTLIPDEDFGVPPSCGLYFGLTIHIVDVTLMIFS